MQSSWDISYKYKKPEAGSWTSSQTTVKAETESTAIRLVKDKKFGCDVIISSIKRK